MKKIIQDYFTFSKRDRNGILVLLFLILLMLLMPHVISVFLPKEKTDFSSFREDIERFKQAVTANTTEKKMLKEYELEEEESTTQAFDFNPNKLTYEQGKALGLNDKIARRITKYLKAGGSFSKKEDLKKIYGLSDEDYRRLAPYAVFDIDAEDEFEGSDNNIGGKNKRDWKKKDREYSSNDRFEKSEKEFELRLALFDPNKLSYERARHLGMSNQAAKALTNFVKKSKDGRPFKKKEDIKKVYGFTDEDYARLEAYIEMEDGGLSLMSDNRGEAEEKGERPATFNDFEESPPILIDINTADVEDWKKLKGIGASFSNRIVKYRNLLGGFTHPEQLKEVYGLDAILYVEIMDFLENNHPENIQKINVNTADEFTLKKHPYINEKLAKAIVKKRIRKGDFPSVDELQKIGGMDSDLFQKLAPYLSVR